VIQKILGTTSVLSFLAGVLSLVILAQQGVLIGMAAPIKEIIDFYGKVVEALLGWADQPVRDAVAYLEQVLGIDLRFDQTWKHVFLLLWLYFSSDFRINLSSSRYAFAVFTLLWGSLVAVVTSVIASSAGLSSSHVNTLAVMAPILGIIVFDTGRCIWGATFSAPDPTAVYLPTQGWIDRFIRRLYIYVVPVMIIGCLILFAARRLGGSSIPDSVLNSNLVLIAIFITLTAFFWIGRGVWLRAMANESSDMMHVGMLMVAVILGAVLFLVLNAGLSVAGL
jgi:hypothetical protein